MVLDILHSWGFREIKLLEDYSGDSPRIIQKLQADGKVYILKGLSENINESIIINNTSAHLYLGNKMKFAPSLIPLKNGDTYIKYKGFYFYLLEYIEGRQLIENEDDEYLLGQAVAKLHSLKGYKNKCSFNSVIQNIKYKEWFKDREFKKEFDQILDNIPVLESYGECFIHTDIGAQNTILTSESEVFFIDLDDAGIGAKYSDLGWSFIMRYVDFNKETHEMKYRFDLAKTFLKGYYGNLSDAKEDLDIIWQGAIHTHIGYMKLYGPDAVESLWKILNFGIQQKVILYAML